MLGQVNTHEGKITGQALALKPGLARSIALSTFKLAAWEFTGQQALVLETEAPGSPAQPNCHMGRLTHRSREEEQLQLQCSMGAKTMS